VDMWDADALQSSTTWNNQPRVYTSWWRADGNGEWQRFDADGMAQTWSNNSVYSGTVELRASNETDPTNWKAYDTGANGYSWPELDVTYNDPPNAPTSLGVNPLVIDRTNTTTPSLYATASDPDGNGGQIQFEVFVYGGGPLVTGGTVPVSASGVEASWQVPPGVLNSGTRYGFHARQYDGYVWGPWSGWSDFLVQAGYVPPPTVASSDFPENQWTPYRTSGTFYFSDPDPSHQYTFYWGRDTPASSPNPAMLQTSDTIGSMPAGWHTLYVVAKDVAGNTSAATAYSFGNGGSGDLTSPLVQGTTQATTLLQARVDPDVTGVDYEYRRGGADAWKAVPAADLTPPGATTHPTYPLGVSQSLTPVLVWSAVSTLGEAAEDGPLQLRACMSGSGAGRVCSTPRQLTWARHAFGASQATATMGPGKVSLLTGDWAVDGTDASLRGWRGAVGAGRTFTSLTPERTGGPQLLTADQQDVEASTTGFTATGGTLSSSTVAHLSGARSLGVVSGGAAESYASIGGDSGGLRAGLLPGHTYTVAAHAYVPTTGGPDLAAAAASVHGLRVVGFVTDAAGTREVASAPVSATGSWQTLSVTLAVPSGATAAWVRLYNGSTSTGPVVYYDGMSVRETSMFGPGWQASPDGAASGAAGLSVRTDSAGTIVFAASNGATETWSNPTGAQDGTYTGLGDAGGTGDKVTRAGTGITRVSADGTSTTWTLTGSVWRPSSVTAAGPSVTPAAQRTTSYGYDSLGRLNEILAPAPPGVTCRAPSGDASTLAEGCRALLFDYATSTTATGTGTDPATWGAMTNLLTGIRAVAWDRGSDGAAAPTRQVISVAAYRYDAAGHLRQAQDPRITPSLPTTYSYDAASPAGRLLTLTPAGLATVTARYDASGRLTSISRPQPGGGTATQAVAYGVGLDPLTGSGDDRGRPDLTCRSGGVTTGGATTAAACTTAGWGQATDIPSTAAAVFPADHPLTPGNDGSITPASADWQFADLSYLDVNGRRTNTASYGAGGWQINSTAYDTWGHQTWQLAPRARNQALVPDADTPPTVTNTTSTAARAQLLATTSTWAGDPGAPSDAAPTRLTDTYSPARRIALPDGSHAEARTHTHTDYDQGAPNAGKDANGAYYRLPTTVTVTACTLNGPSCTDSATEKRVTTTTYNAIIGTVSGWDVRAATSTHTVLGGGQPDLVRTTGYDTLGRVTETRMPANPSGGDAHATLTTYYTADTSSPVPACTSKPAYAGLPCQTGPAAQPAGPPVPVSRTIAYTWQAQPLQTIDSSGAATRTTTATYDPAGRPLSNTVTTSGEPAGQASTPVPAQSLAYDATTGLPLRASITETGTTTSAGVTGYDTLGRPTTATDADGNTTTTRFDIDGRISTITDTKGTVTYTYDNGGAAGSSEHRGLPTTKNNGTSGTNNTSAGSFTASYDADGRLASQSYPNGITTRTAYDTVGAPTTLTYSQNGATLLGFTQDRDVFAKIRMQTSPRSQQTFGYDPAGRLTRTDDTDTTAGTSTSRSYSYDADSNRTALSVTSSYRSTVLADNPDGYWRLDETGGTTLADATGHGHPATPHNGVLLGVPAPADGEPTRGARFDGAGGYASATVTPATANRTPFTDEVWFTTPTNIATTPTLIGEGVAGDGWQFYLGPGGSLNYGAFDHSNGRNDNTWTSTPDQPALLDGGWHYAAVSYDGTTLSYYADGKLVSTVAGVTMPPNSSPGDFHLGVADDLNYTTDYLAGNLDNVAVYPRALTPARITAHYRAGLDGRHAQTNSYDAADRLTVPGYAAKVSSSAPAAWYRLDDSTGTAAVDSSGHGLTGTYVGTYTRGVGGTVTGDADPATTFDGSSGQVSVPDTTALRLNGGFTLSLTAKMNAESGYPGLLGKGNSYSGDGWIVFENPGDHSLHFKRATQDYSAGPNTLGTDRYRSHTISYDASAKTLTFYVDGNPTISYPNVTFPTTTDTSPLRLGVGDGYAAVTLDEVALYNRTLTRDEIGGIRAAQLAGSTTYDLFGRTLSLPGGTTNGGPTATLGYYANDLTATQSQGATTKTYRLDPLRRVRTITDSSTGRTVTYHYATTTSGGSESPAWIDNGDNTTSRYLTDLTGAMTEEQDQTGSVTLHLSNLHGDTVADAPNTATGGLTNYREQTEFGVARDASTHGPTAPDARYAWLGGAQRSTDATAGLLLMGVRLYAPSSGRFLQVDPVRGGSANSYDYGGQDPSGNLDLDGRWFYGRLLPRQSSPGAVGYFDGQTYCNNNSSSLKASYHCSIAFAITFYNPAEFYEITRVIVHAYVNGHDAGEVYNHGPNWSTYGFHGTFGRPDDDSKDPYGERGRYSYSTWFGFSHTTAHLGPGDTIELSLSGSAVAQGGQRVNLSGYAKWVIPQ